MYVNSELLSDYSICRALILKFKRMIEHLLTFCSMSIITQFPDMQFIL